MADISADRMRQLVKEGEALPGTGDDPGRFPIRNCSDLHNAVRAVGRAKGSHAKIRRFIMKRQRALKCPNDPIPDDWNSDGSLKS